MLFLTLWFVFDAHKWFKGPKVNIEVSRARGFLGYRKLLTIRSTICLARLLVIVLATPCRQRIEEMWGFSSYISFQFN
jgi:hypothetical protein